LKDFHSIGCIGALIKTYETSSFFVILEKSVVAKITMQIISIIETKMNAPDMEIS
jgi:hypothetical protein